MHDIANKSELQFTGERLVTSVKEYWALEHLHRYAIVTELIEGKDVVDVASGEGYGANILCRFANTVVGIDISKEVVDHAKSKYTGANLKFVVGSATKMPLENASIDVVISFETLEHHDRHDEMMLEVKRVLKPEGILIISTPDKLNYSDIPGYTNSFHVKELYRHEFQSLIDQHFRFSTMLSQKSIVASIITSRCSDAIATKEFIGTFTELESSSEMQDVIYNICVASSKPLPAEKINCTSFFHNTELTNNYFNLLYKYDELKRENEAIIRKNSSVTYRVKGILSLPFDIYRSAKKRMLEKK